jgi:GNAT superfamily N-acetyltransferase
MPPRPREARDLTAAARLLEAVHRLDGYPTHWPQDPERWLSPRDQLGAWVMDADGAVAGHVALSSVGDGHGARIWARHGGFDPALLASVSRLFVARDRRGSGVGGELLDAACAEASERGLQPVLDVVETNAAAIALYERRGWRRVFSEPWREARGEPLTLHYYSAAPR